MKNIIQKIIKFLKIDKVQSMYPEFPDAELPVKQVINTKAVSLIDDYSLIKGKIYNIEYDLYNTGDISWYRFIDEKSVIRITGSWKFKLLADMREEKLNFLLDEY
jgi:hypothetical protein